MAGGPQRVSPMSHLVPSLCGLTYLHLQLFLLGEEMERQHPWEPPDPHCAPNPPAPIEPPRTHTLPPQNPRDPHDPHCAPRDPNPPSTPEPTAPPQPPWNPRTCSSRAPRAALPRCSSCRPRCSWARAEGTASPRVPPYLAFSSCQRPRACAAASPVGAPHQPPKKGLGNHQSLPKGCQNSPSRT